jgi:hypothetical protein
MPFLGALAGVELGLLRTYVTYNPGIHYTFKGQIWNGQGTPPALNYYGIPMVSIYSTNFLDSLMSYIQAILAASSHTSPYINFILEVLLDSGQVKTVGHGFVITPSTDLEKLRTTLNEYIEGFETQSGVPEERQPEAVISSLLKVMDRSEAPAVDWNDPLGLPQSKISPAPKPRPSPKATAEKLAVINSQINCLSSDIKLMTSEIVQAIKSNPTPTPTQPTLLSGVNWTPILHGITNVIVSSLGGSPVSFPKVVESSMWW